MDNAQYAEFPVRTGWQALNEAQVYVTKIGGTRAAELASNADTIEKRRQAGKKQIFAISAMRSADKKYGILTHGEVTKREIEKEGKSKTGFNTTSHLILIADLIQKNDLEQARVVLTNIRRFTREMVSEQVSNDGSIAEKEPALKLLYEIIDTELDALERHIAEENAENVLPVGEDRLIATDEGYFSITGAGENLARAIYAAYLRIRNQNTSELKEDGISADIFGEEPRELAYDCAERDEIMRKLTDTMRNRIAVLLPDNDVLISGGYFSGAGSERGYSELTAALLASAAQTNYRVACLIEKDWPIMSSDPNKIANVKLIERMTYELAFELFGNQRAGADSQAIHAPALDVLAQNNVDIIVFNPDKPERGSTLISNFDTEGITGAEVIESRRIPDALVIKTTKMQGPGFMHEIGGWFKEHKISVSLIPSSEITMSLTFNNGGPNQAQIREFQEFLRSRYGKESASLNIIPGQSLVYCLGHNVMDSDAPARALEALRSVNIRPNMITAGYAKTGIIFSLDNDDVDKAAHALHEFCVEKPAKELILSSSPAI